MSKHQCCICGAPARVSDSVWHCNAFPNCKPPEQPPEMPEHPYMSMTCVHCGNDAFCPKCDDERASDDAELAAIRRRLSDMCSFDDAVKLLHKVDELSKQLSQLEHSGRALVVERDELTVQIAAERKLRDGLLPDGDPAVAATVARLVADRDELRAKLAEAERYPRTRVFADMGLKLRAAEAQRDEARALAIEWSDAGDCPTIDLCERWNEVDWK